jgi:cytochrome c-type biogenesis protein CcmH/NrfG
MFFPKLRRKAKPLFILLALVFGLSFVALGVGTGVSGTSVGDILNDVFNTGGSGPSIEDAQKKVEENPEDREALIALADAFQAEGRTAGAIATLERYRGLEPKDLDVLKRLAGLYTIQAQEVQQRVSIIQTGSQRQLFGQIFGPPPDTELGQALGNDPIAEAIRQQANERLALASDEFEAAYRRVAGVYQELTLLEPEEPSNFLQLGQASQIAGDSDSAIAAYKTFLELSPDDALAPTVRAQLEALDPTLPTVTTGESPGETAAATAGETASPADTGAAASPPSTG